MTLVWLRYDSSIAVLIILFDPGKIKEMEKVEVKKNAETLN